MNARNNQRNKTIQMDDDIEFKNLDITQLVKNYMIREAFSIFDEDRSGDIDKKEFKNLINTLGWGISDSRISELMKEVDKDGSGTIDFEEFAKMMNNYQFTKDSPISQHLESAFNLYDKDGDDYINVEDFKKVGEEIDGVINDKDAVLFINMVKFFSKSKDIKQTSNSKISKEEFINFLFNINFLEEIKIDKNRMDLTMSGIKDKNMLSSNVSRSNSRISSMRSSHI
jgi:Ca2+-binding EF-hand superfamily protein